MTVNKSHNHLIDNITRAISGTCEESAVIMKVIDYVNSTARESIEPGVEIVDSLSQIFRDTIAHALELNCDLTVIVKGLIIGTFRSSDDIKLEAHKTIEHMTRLVVEIIYELRGNTGAAIRGMLEGVAEGALEERLNLETALNEAARDAVGIAVKLSKEYGSAVRQAASCEIMDIKIQVPEEAADH